MRLDAKEYPFDRRLQAVIVNTVMATHSLTLVNEDLGSSNGLEKQTFRTLRAPVFPVSYCRFWSSKDLVSERCVNRRRQLRDNEGERARANRAKGLGS